MYLYFRCGNQYPETAWQSPYGTMHPPGRPPVVYFRFGWGTMLLLRRDAIPGGIISFASDIGQRIYPIAGIQPEGYARYESGEFGWLQGTRKARLYRLTPWTREEVAANIAAITRADPYIFPEEDPFWELLEDLKLTSGDCLFYENGEKEFSCEVAQVAGSGAELLLRYTIGGWDQGDRPDEIRNFCRIPREGTDF